jgi:hypothetical protein
MGGGRSVVGRVLVAATGSKLYHPLSLNVQGFKLLTDDTLRHPLAEVLYQQPHTSVHWK